MDSLMLIIVIILILWVLGFAFNLGGLVHLLLVVVLILVIIRLARGRSLW